MFPFDGVIMLLTDEIKRLTAHNNVIRVYIVHVRENNIVVGGRLLE